MLYENQLSLPKISLRKDSIKIKQKITLNLPKINHFKTLSMQIKNKI
jgi:hypothetical protein